MATPEPSHWFEGAPAERELGGAAAPQPTEDMEPGGGRRPVRIVGKPDRLKGDYDFGTGAKHLATPVPETGAPTFKCESRTLEADYGYYDPEAPAPGGLALTVAAQGQELASLGASMARLEELMLQLVQAPPPPAPAQPVPPPPPLPSVYQPQAPADAQANLIAALCARLGVAGSGPGPAPVAPAMPPAAPPASYMSNPLLPPERRDHLVDPDMQRNRCHMMLNGGSRVPAFAAGMALKASAESIKLTLLAQGGAPPEVVDSSAGLQTYPGQPAPFQFELTGALVQHLVAASWGPHGISLGALGPSVQVTNPTVLHHEVEQIGGIMIGGSHALTALSTTAPSKRPQAPPVSDGYALARCVENAMGLLQVLYPDSVDPAAFTAWRFFHDVMLFLRYLHYKKGPADGQWAQGVVALVDQRMADYVQHLRTHGAGTDVSNPHAVTATLRSAYRVAFTGLFTETLHRDKAQYRNAVLTPPAPPSAEAQFAMMQAALPEVCARYLAGSCKQSAKACKFSHDLTTPQALLVIRALLANPPPGGSA